jgi:hypothetical protein
MVYLGKWGGCELSVYTGGGRMGSKNRSICRVKEEKMGHDMSVCVERSGSKYIIGCNQKAFH